MTIKHLENLAFGILEIDNQHAEFIRAYDEFFNQGGPAEKLDALPGVIGFLDEHAQSQFKYEELLILKTHYEDGGRQREEHRKFLSDLEAFKDQLRQEGATIQLFFALKGNLIRWMISHIGRTDQDFCDFLLACEGKNNEGYAGQKLGEILIKAGIISRTTLERAIERQQGTGKKLGEVLEHMGVVGTGDISSAISSQEGKKRLAKKLGAILVESGLISQVTLDHALELQKESGKMLGALLVDMGVISTEQIIEAQAVQKGILEGTAGWAEDSH
jgi:hemerythrin-like metal-binding protein